MGNRIVYFLNTYLHIPYQEAMNFYDQVFRQHADLLFFLSILIVFFILIYFFLRILTHYFDSIHQGLDSLLDDQQQRIRLEPEMEETEIKLNAIKKALLQKDLIAKEAEQRKNQLIMYLAHDIRTPLTSVMGYLNLLEEKQASLSMEERAKYTHIALDKAHRLEHLIQEFFDITAISLENIDLYYMLIQMKEEFYPILLEKDMDILLLLDEDLTIQGDANMLARAFGNLLRNATSYGYPHSKIVISSTKDENHITLFFQNKGKTIPPAQLAQLFNQFYRLDESRNTASGGAGLGLSITKDIILMHHGDISVQSKDDQITFTLTLPIHR